MIVIVNSKAIELFNKKVEIGHKTNTSDDSDLLNKWLRLSGTNYAINEFIKFYNDNGERNEYGYGLEHKTWLYLDKKNFLYNIIRIGEENLVGNERVVTDDSPDVNTGSTSGSTGVDPKAKLHTHINAGLTDFVTGIGSYSDEPSRKEDAVPSLMKNNYYNIVVTPKYIWFFDKKDDAPIFKLQKNIIFDKSAVNQNTQDNSNNNQTNGGG